MFFLLSHKCVVLAMAACHELRHKKSCTITSLWLSSARSLDCFFVCVVLALSGVFCNEVVTR